MSFSEISQTTQTMLLLTGRFGISQQSRLADSDIAIPLTTRELNTLVERLKNRAIDIAELTTPGVGANLPELAGRIDSGRLQRLLGRGFKMALAIEKWQQRGIWVLSREDEDYPQTLIGRLGENAPPIIYGCGEVGLFNCDGLAIQGSRNADDEVLGHARTFGVQAADAGMTVVTGGARGVDRAAMNGALDADGCAIGILTNGLSSAAIAPDNRIPIGEERLLLISPFDPEAGFNVGNAMGRNKLIFALSRAGLVVESDYEKGGTWAGATEQIRRLKYVPMFVHSTGRPSKGLDALRAMGAREWPDPEDSIATRLLLDEIRSGAFSRNDSDIDRPSLIEQPRQPAMVMDAGEPFGSVQVENSTPKVILKPSKDLFSVVRPIILATLDEPKSRDEVAKELDLVKRQTDKWLARLVDEGAVNKLKRPVRYIATSTR